MTESVQAETVQAASTARDFDFWMGWWNVRNRRLRERLAGATEWEEFASTMELVRAGDAS